MMDGVAAGLVGVALPGLVASILRGSGHVNAGLGAVMAVQGVGAALSPALAGWVAQRFGYGPAFIALSVAAAVSLGLIVTHRAECGGARFARAGRVPDVHSSY